MAGNNQGNPRLVKFVNLLMDTLKEERNNVNTAVDECINQIQREVDGFVSGSHGKQATYEEISNRLQQAIPFFIAKSGELSGMINMENERDESITLVQNTLTSCGPSTSPALGSSTSMGVTTVKETLLSLKRTMEQLQEKQENFDKKLNDVTNKQENFNKEIEILTNANLRSQKNFKERLIAVEKRSLESSATVDNLHKEFSVNVDARVK